MRIAKAFEAHRPTMRVLVPLIAFFGETLTGPMTIAAVRKDQCFGIGPSFIEYCDARS
jgi:hypothetical protein